MRAVVQRVSDCSVVVEGVTKGRISNGLLTYLGIGRGDTDEDLDFLVQKVPSLRIFADADGKMNLSVKDAGGQILVISQFTLFGDVRRGRRPSYTEAADPATAEEYYARFVGALRGAGCSVQSGVFAAMMRVTYTNEGPVTILIDSRKRF